MSCASSGFLAISSDEWSECEVPAFTTFMSPVAAAGGCNASHASPKLVDGCHPQLVLPLLDYEDLVRECGWLGFW